ncbi:hypothetical protein [Candidatus Albibeggiatoa sp. nov. NOAA]|uniref:hypothetical protein n=1 Tax=Candidatus Albibeggiatoa sp. nov. NOAA TaxID=3162724 RepID=UPI0033017EDF|nr:DUF4407 domain-containing protein [Thiotrichaceae bacterium]
MKVKLKTNLLQNILIGIFVSVISGLIVFFLTEYQKTASEPPAVISHTDNPIYKLLQTEQQKLALLTDQLAEKEQELLDTKQEEGFTGTFFDGAEAGKIRQEIDYLEENIEEAEDKIIKFSHELDRISARSQKQQYPIFSLIVVGITFVAMVALLTLLSLGS